MTVKLNHVLQSVFLPINNFFLQVLYCLFCSDTPNFLICRKQEVRLLITIVDKINCGIHTTSIVTANSLRTTQINKVFVVNRICYIQILNNLFMYSIHMTHKHNRNFALTEDIVISHSNIVFAELFWKIFSQILFNIRLLRLDKILKPFLIKWLHVDIFPPNDYFLCAMPEIISL